MQSIPSVFAAAAADLGKPGGDADPDVVSAVWRRITPGLLDAFDAPASLPCIAPRPLLIANGELDARCPMPGVVQAVDAARPAYGAAGVPHALRLFAEPGVGHQATPAMLGEVRSWFDAWLLRPEGGPEGGAPAE